MPGKKDLQGETGISGLCNVYHLTGFLVQGYLLQNKCPDIQCSVSMHISEMYPLPFFRYFFKKVRGGGDYEHVRA